MSKLQDFKVFYDRSVERLKRLSDRKRKPYCSKDYIDGAMHELISSFVFIINDILSQEDFPVIHSFSPKEADEQFEIDKAEGDDYDKQLFSPVSYIEIFDKKYPIYLDDYGQCYCIKLDKHHYEGLGTYCDLDPRNLMTSVLYYIHDINYQNLIK